jgi:hypothetical protein
VEARVPVHPLLGLETLERLLLTQAIDGQEYREQAARLFGVKPSTKPFVMPPPEEKKR